MRSSGILLPIFSLPSPYGYGDLGDEAYKFINRLSEAGQKYWQVLPVNPVNKEYCPYQSSSSFAGEPMLISTSERRHLTEGRPSDDEPRIAKAKALRKAHEEFKALIKSGTDEGNAQKSAFEEFCSESKQWLDDYALFEALSDKYGTGDWSTWDEDIRDRNEDSIKNCVLELGDEVFFYKWTQFEFMRQWKKLREYANERGVELIGDLPYYAAYESADCWANPQLFQLDENRKPIFEAGAPPDAFASEGQRWGNPVYDWEEHEAQNYRWWISRIKQQFKLFDVLRLDHMRGFESYYVIPDDTGLPKDGHWEKGPGMDLFNAMAEEVPGGRYIAEDLGYLTEEVRTMMNGTGFPGMKILQFAFDTSEENVYLPFNYDTDNSVIYTGTHDNDTTLGWYEKAEDWKKDFVTWYLREKSDVEPGGSGRLESAEAVKGLVELAHSSRCDTCIIPVQDYLMLGSEARINVPGTVKGNWRWQMDEGTFTPELAQHIRRITERYGRC